MKYLFLTVAIYILMIVPIMASEDGGTTSPFRLGTGARELALGGSNIAESDFSSSPYWNASRLATAERYSLAGLHSRLFFQGSVYQYIGLAVPTLDHGGFGIGIFRQAIDGIERRDNANQLLGETQENKMRVYLAHGRSWQGYEVGVAATIEYHSLDGLSSTSSPGLDISAGRRFIVHRWWLRSISTAINIRNLLRPGIKLADDTYRYPSEIKAGAAFNLKPHSSDDNNFLVSLSLSKGQNVSTRLAVGLEYSLMESFHIRGGSDGGNLSVGVGLQYDRIKFDYVVADRDFGSLHMVNLITSFGESKKIRLIERARVREEEFRNAMNEQLSARNKVMLEELIASGKRNMDSLNYSEAFSELERAMFLARSTGTDTAGIGVLLSRAKANLDSRMEQREFEKFMDSARVCASRSDHIAAKYFASQALALKPDTDSARIIFDYANRELEQSTTRNEMIATKLSTIDSLVELGQIHEASLLMESMEEFAAEDEGVMLRTTRIELELLQKRYSNAIENENVRSGNDFTNSTGDENIEIGLKTTDINDLSPQIRSEIDNNYRKAKQHFGKGNLDDAITLWEKVNRMAPGYRSVRDYLVKAYTFVGVELYAQKSREDALDIWNKAARLDPNNAEVQSYVKRTKNEILTLKELSHEYLITNLALALVVLVTSCNKHHTIRFDQMEDVVFDHGATRKAPHITADL